MSDVVLPGCTPEPLAAYLSALGVLRVVDQHRVGATLAWTAGGAVVSADGLDRAALEQLLLEDYEPSPIVSPWNAGAGLRRNGKSATAERTIATIEASAAARLETYRRTVAAARTIADRYLDEDVFKGSKDAIVTESRGELPDEAIAWIDAAVVVTPSGLRFPDILGTGGNLGRIDLSSNFQQRILDLFDPETGAPSKRSRGWLRDALDGAGGQPRVKATVGQYEPGAAGGVNTSTSDDGHAFVNPWRFVLAIEGLTFFASAVSRRLGVRGQAAYPFAVRAATVASRHLSEAEPAKDHLYVPVWPAPATAPEVQRLFGEGRLSWGRGQAATSVDAVRAIASLGVDRGLAGFQRFAVVERLGQNTLAVPAGWVAVGDRGPVRLTRMLDGWVGRVRRAHRPPGALVEALRAYDLALVQLAEASAAEQPSGGRALVTALAELERVVARNTLLREEIAPVPRLRASGWVDLLDDGTPEFELAAGWASLNDVGPRRTGQLVDHGRAIEGRSSWRGSVQAYVRGVVTGGPWPTWSTRRDRAPDVERDGPRALAAIHASHATQADLLPHDLKPAIGGSNTGFRFGLPVSLSSVEAYLDGRLDRARIARWLRSLVLVDFDLDAQAVSRWVSRERMDRAVPDPLYRCLAPLVLGAPVVPDDDERDREIRLTADPSWPRRLRDGVGFEAIGREAVTRYRASRIAAPVTSDVGTLGAGRDSERGPLLGAALLLHLRHSDLASLQRPETRRPTTEDVPT